MFKCGYQHVQSGPLTLKSRSILGCDGTFDLWFQIINIDTISNCLVIESVALEEPTIPIHALNDP